MIGNFIIFIIKIEIYEKFFTPVFNCIFYA